MMIRVIWFAMTPTASRCRINWKNLSPVTGLPRSFKISSFTRSIAILPVKPGLESILLICGCNSFFTSHTGVFIILFYLILLFRNVWERRCCLTASQLCLVTAFSPGSQRNPFWNCFDGILFPMWLIWKTSHNSRKRTVTNVLNVLPFLWVAPESSNKRMTAARCMKKMCETMTWHVWMVQSEQNSGYGRMDGLRINIHLSQS